PDGEGRENEMEADREGELQPGKEDGVEVFEHDGLQPDQRQARPTLAPGLLAARVRQPSRPAGTPRPRANPPWGARAALPPAGEWAGRGRCRQASPHP